MKIRTIALSIALIAPIAKAENLSSSDREALLEKLEKIRDEATSKVDARFKTAMSAFKSAMASDDAAADLYLKCEEMVNFDELKKKSGDFRDWKRANSNRLSDPEFKLALRQQLRWLVLTLEAASENPDRDQLAVEAAKIVDSIVSQADHLSEQRGVLQQNVTDTVFARAYNINSVKIENWPLAPLAIGQIYDQILLPPVRRPDRLSSLKATWAKRMVHESTLVDVWSGKPGEKPKAGVHSPEYEKFIANTLPNLQWKAEVDQFKAGDQRAAALRMLAHIEKNLAHESSSQWGADFTALLQKESDPAPDAETPPNDGEDASE